MRTSIVGLGFVAAILAVGCRKETPPAAAQEVTVLQVAAIPTEPGDPAWDEAPEFAAPLLPQDLVEPRLLDPATKEVRVRAVTDGRDLGFRLEWTDPSDDDRLDLALFGDACAVQLPTGVGPDLPAPQMGEAGRPVEITYWRATWQATVDGREDSIRAIYPHATVDHYPFEAPSLAEGSAAAQEMAALYAPARSLGNMMAGPRDQPVEDLVSEGPGSLAPAAQSGSRGMGRRTEGGWAVVLTRRLPANLTGGARTQVAFAVWEGSGEEVGARKARSGWVPLVREVAQ